MTFRPLAALLGGLLLLQIATAWQSTDPYGTGGEDMLCNDNRDPKNPVKPWSWRPIPNNVVGKFGDYTSRIIDSIIDAPSGSCLYKALGQCTWTPRSPGFTLNIVSTRICFQGDIYDLDKARDFAWLMTAQISCNGIRAYSKTFSGRITDWHPSNCGPVPCVPQGAKVTDVDVYGSNCRY